MFQPRKYKKKELLEIFRTRNDNALLALIDSLWREYPAQWKEQKLSLADIDKADPTHADYDSRYKYVRNDFRNADETQTTSYATAHGFGHVARADFAQVFGFFNYALSFFQTTLGPFSKIPENQTPDEWINTDLLYVLGNGKDDLNRSNVVEIFKSGLVHWHNAQVIGAYEHGNEGEPAPELIPGLIQYTAANGFECVKEDLQWHPFGESAYEIAVRNGFVGTEIEWLASLQGADGDDGAPGSDGAPGVDGTDGKSAYEVAVDNGFVGTEAEWLASLEGADGDPAPDTFIGLSDTSAAYPATNKGQLVKQSGAEEVGFAAKIGEEISGLWIKARPEEKVYESVSGTLVGNERHYTTIINDFYRITYAADDFSEPTREAYLYVNGILVVTFPCDNVNRIYTFTADTTTTTVLIELEGTASAAWGHDVEHQIDTIESIPLRFVNENHETIAEITAGKDFYADSILEIGEKIKINVSKGLFGIKELILSQLKVGTPGNIAYSFPETDGSAGQALLTDGKGGLTWQAVLTAITKSMVEAVLTGEITSHSHPNNVPGTETLSGTSVTLDWNGNTTATLTMGAATTISYGTIKNYVKRLSVSGNYALTLPATTKIISGEYDGTVQNIIDFIPAGGSVWVTINQEA